MSTDGKNNFTRIQCQTCGQIYDVPYEVSIDKLYVMADCPECGIAIGLNLGNEEEDTYYFYNANLDPRYY